MLISSNKIRKALRVVSVCGLLFVSLRTIAQTSKLQGEITTYVSIRPAKEISGLGYASLYNKKNYWQVRYNYEDRNTVSFFWGKPFTTQKKFYVQVVPSVGFSAGNFTGFSPAIHFYAENSQFEFYSSNQYSMCVTKFNRSFFFNWSEAIYKFRDIVKVGAAFQFLKEYKVQNNKELTQAAQEQIDFGLVTGIQYKKFYVSGYFFNFWQPQRHYALALTYNFQ